MTPSETAENPNVSSSLLKQQMLVTLIFPSFVCRCTAGVGFIVTLPNLENISVCNFCFMRAKLFWDLNEKDLH